MDGETSDINFDQHYQGNLSEDGSDNEDDRRSDIPQNIMDDLAVGMDNQDDDIDSSSSSENEDDLTGGDNPNKVNLLGGDIGQDVRESNDMVQTYYQQQQPQQPYYPAHSTMPHLVGTVPLEFASGTNQQMPDPTNEQMIMKPPHPQMVSAATAMVDEHSTPVLNNHHKPLINGNFNYMMNQFSTPSNAQNPPLHVLQTAIPSIPEENFNRKRPSDPYNVNGGESTPANFIGNGLDHPVTNGVISDGGPADQFDEENSPPPHAMIDINGQQIQHQHHVQHGKYRSMERFAAPLPAAVYPKSTLPSHQTDPNMTIEEAGELGQHQKYVNQFQADLNNLTKEELDELRKEEEQQMQQQSEFFNSNHAEELNRLNIQLNILYNARGRKLEDVSNRYMVYQQEVQRDIRALKHQLTCKDGELETLKSSIDAMREREKEMLNELEKMIKAKLQCEEKIEKLCKTNKDLEGQKISCQHEIEGLQAQINEQQQLDSYQKERERYEHTLENMRAHQEFLEKKMRELETELTKRNEIIDHFKNEREEMLLKHADTVRRINEYQESTQIQLLQSESKKKSAQIEQLNQRCIDLERDLKLATTSQVATADSMSATTTTVTSNRGTLHSEIDSLTRQLKERRNEINSVQAENETLKRLVNDLEAEKAEMANDLADTRVKLDNALAKDEDNEKELHNSRFKIMELERMIEAIRAENSQELIAQKYQLEFVQKNVRIDELERELQKTKNMYIDVCEEKNNLQITLKDQLDEEYQQRLKQAVETETKSRLEEYRLKLDIEFNKKLDLKQEELKNLKLERTNAQNTFAQLESQLKTRIADLEGIIEEKEITLKEMRQKIESLTLDKSEHDQLNAKHQEATKSVFDLTQETKRLQESYENAQLECERVKKELMTEKSKVSEFETGRMAIENELKEIKGQKAKAEEELTRLRETKGNDVERELADKESQIKDEKEKVVQLEALVIKLKTELALHCEQAREATGKLEQARQQWASEKSALVSKKDSEIQEIQEQIKILEQRFEVDYTKFISTHKEAMNRALGQKSAENKKLTEIYLQKFGDYENEQQELLGQIKDLKEKHKKELDEVKREHEKEINALRENFQAEIKQFQETRGNNSPTEITDAKAIETVEQSYRSELDSMQTKFETHLKEMQAKFDSDLQRSKNELSEQYKQALAKQKNEIDQMQTLVQKYKKTTGDSGQLIESMKTEMKKLREAHLNELTQLTMNAEREKQMLSESYEQTVRRMHSLERQLQESDDSTRKQVELMRAELKAEYGYELSKMNNKMKDMMRSHADAIEILKRQHQSLKRTSVFPSLTIDVASQTDLDMKEVDNVDAFRKRYLDTITKIKGEMLKEFDAQTIRMTEKVRRQINDDRALIKEKIAAVFMPKISDLLKEYLVSDIMIEIKMDELKSDLEQITSEMSMNGVTAKRHSRPSSASKNDNGGSSSARLHGNHSSPSRITKQLAEGIETAQRLLNRIEENGLSQSGSSGYHTTKRSASVLGSAIRPNLAKSDDFSLSNSVSALYSKSVTNMNEYQLSSGASSLLSPRQNLAHSNDRHNEPFLGSLSSSSSHQRLGEFKSPLTVTTGNLSNKYTPLRQSWNNLALLSPTFNNLESDKRIINEEENGDDDEFKSMASLSKINRFVSTGRSRAIQTELNKPINLEQSTDEEDKASKASQQEDYIYVDDDFDMAKTGSKNDYFHKYRTQNIRQKKSQPKPPDSQPNQATTQRPISATAGNLVRTSSNFLPLSSNNASNQTTNQIQSLNKVQRSNTTNVADTNLKMMNGSITKQKGNSKNSANETESDETPTRLPGASDSDESSSNTKIRTTSSSRTATSSMTVSTSSNNSTGMSRSRSREKSSGGGTLDSKNGSLKSGQSDLPVYSSTSISYSNLSNPSGVPSFMNSTKSSIGKSIYSTASHSTYYHPIGSGSVSNLVKNSVFQKKKNAFY